jgi:hypothetical protein
MGIPFGSVLAACIAVSTVDHRPSSVWGAFGHIAPDLGPSNSADPSSFPHKLHLLTSRTVSESSPYPVPVRVAVLGNPTNNSLVNPAGADDDEPISCDTLKGREGK